MSVRTVCGPRALVIHRPSRLAVCLVVLACLCMSGCDMVTGSSSPSTGHRDAAGLPLGPVTCGDLKAHTEYRLLLPHSSDGGAVCEGEGQDQIEGNLHAATVQGSGRADISPDQVLAWYDGWLLGHGWSSSKAVDVLLRPGQEFAAGYYQRGRERFVASVSYPVGLRQSLIRSLEYFHDYSICPLASGAVGC